ncbi:hypothetical protein D3C78_1040290 [compost metagenome]
MSIRLADILKRTKTGNSMYRYIPVQLVPWLQIMHITCCNNRFAKFMSDIDNFTDRSFKLLSTVYQAFINQMHIHS